MDELNYLVCQAHTYFDIINMTNEIDLYNSIYFIVEADDLEIRVYLGN